MSGKTKGGVSKNARMNVVTQKHYCECGGEIKMVAVFQGKMRMKARCDKCGNESRKPSDFKRIL